MNNLTTEQVTFLVGLLSGAGGAIGSEAFRWWRSRGKERRANDKAQIDEATQIRKEMREQNAALTKRLDQVTLDLDAWKTKYYELLGRWTELNAENTELREENADQKKKMAEMQTQIDALRAQPPLPLGDRK